MMAGNTLKRSHQFTLPTTAAAVILLAGGSQAASVNLTPTGDNYIRNGSSANSTFDTTELLVGRVQGGNWIRNIQQFDLSSIPDSATINSVTLDLFIDSTDGSSGTGWVGGDGIRVYELTSDAVFTGTASQSPTYNERDNVNNVAWTTAGGDFNSSTVLTSFTDTDGASTNPNNVSPGDQFNFATSADFVNAIANNLGDDEVQLIVRTPTIESNFATRKLYRFASSENANTALRPVLTVNYTPIPEPGSLALLGLGGLLVARRRRG